MSSLARLTVYRRLSIESPPIDQPGWELRTPLPTGPTRELCIQHIISWSRTQLHTTNPIFVFRVPSVYLPVSHTHMFTQTSTHAPSRSWKRIGISSYTGENWPNSPNYGITWANLIHHCNYLASATSHIHTKAQTNKHSHAQTHTCCDNRRYWSNAVGHLERGNRDWSSSWSSHPLVPLFLLFVSCQSFDSPLSPNCGLFPFWSSLILTPSYCPNTRFSFNNRHLVSIIHPSSPFVSFHNPSFFSVPPCFHSFENRNTVWTESVLVRHAFIYSSFYRVGEM